MSPQPHSSSAAKALTHLAVAGYRSLQQFTLPLGGLTLAAARGDLAAAVQTILEIGDGDAFQAAIADAFPGCHLTVDTSAPLFQLQLHQPGLLRPLEATELSDGSLRYLLLAAALFSRRLPPLLVLNEPENSLHPAPAPLVPPTLFLGSSNHRSKGNGSRPMR